MEIPTPTTTSAPFTTNEIENINAYQDSGAMHPLTCQSDEISRDHCERDNKISEGKLRAIKECLICPCGRYRQFWVHKSIANGEPVFIK